MSFLHHKLSLSYNKKRKVHCKAESCGKDLMEGEIRVGFYQERRGNKAHSGYVHLHCLHHARPHADIGELNSLDGFEKLSEHDRLLLAKFFAGEKVLASEFSSIVTRQRSASPQLKRGRSASPAKAEGQRSASPQLKRGRSASPAKAEGAKEQVAE